MGQNRCGNFSIDVEEVPVSGVSVVLRVPIRRCALAERMIALIAATENGNAMASRLRIDFTKQIPGPVSAGLGATEPPPIRSAFGPDLEAIAVNECSVQRCTESCSPSYKTILWHFGYTPDAEPDPGFGCADPVGTGSLFIPAAGE